MEGYTCGKIKTGDNGQRYEIRYTDSKGKQKVFGWANDPAAFVQSIILNPSMNSPVVVDRRAHAVILAAKALVEKLRGWQVKHPCFNEIYRAELVALEKALGEIE